MRRWLVVLIAVSVCTGLTPQPSARAQNGPSIPPCDTPRALPVTLAIRPQFPKPGDTVYLEAISPCEACLDLQEIAFDSALGWVVRSTSGPLEHCDLIDCVQPDILRVPIGTSLGGSATLHVTKENLVTDGGTVCVIREQTTLSYGSDEPCMWLTWGGANLDCNAKIAPDRPATLRLALRATEPVLGFQGKLFLSERLEGSVRPSGLEVTDVKAVDFAAGMRVLWNPTSDGASFVLYSETGELLPACNPIPACPACCLPSSVLEVTVAVREGARVPPVSELLVWEVYGADSLGGPIYACVRNEDDRRAMTARICAERPCDANGDGHTDIRDLVTMVRCINEPDACAADPGADLDCDEDGDLDLADVICCAHYVLHGRLPGDAETVPAPGVHVRFGEPVRTESGVDVPIEMHADHLVSAARLGLSFPQGPFVVGGVSVAESSRDWLALHEVAEDGLSLGFIRTDLPGAIPEDPDIVEAVLHLTLKPGASVTGEVRLGGADFSGAGGEALVPGESDHAVQLAPAPAAFTLAPPRPNPFTHETSFALSLDREADVELTVHDLSGRRVATLHRGRLAAGPHAFTWTGTTGRGAAPNGLYFVRAQIEDRVLSRKVALLRGR